MICEIDGESEIGEKIVEVYMEGLKTFKDFYRTPNTHRTNQ